jgi:DNA-binding MarR family transcriptional regulator
MTAKRREQLEVLTADVRLRILKLIHKKQGTVEQLSDQLDIAQSHVKKHIAKLKQTRLIERKKVKDEMKWVLTLKGLALLDPEEKKMWIAGSLFVITIASATAAYLQTRLAGYYNPQVQTAQAGSINPLGLYLLLGLTLIFAIFLMRAHQRRKQYEKFLRFKKD